MKSELSDWAAQKLGLDDLKCEWVNERVVRIRGEQSCRAAGREVENTLAANASFPQAVPEVIEADRSRGWLLLRAIDGGRTINGANREELCHAATTWTLLQRKSVGLLDESQFRDWDTIEVGPCFSILEAEGFRSALGIERGIVVALVEHFNHLSEIDLPNSLVHGDLTRGNVLTNKNGRLWFLDWSDSAIGSPLIDAVYFSVANHARLGAGEEPLAAREVLGSWTGDMSDRDLDEFDEVTSLLVRVYSDVLGREVKAPGEILDVLHHKVPFVGNLIRILTCREATDS